MFIRFLPRQQKEAWITRGNISARSIVPATLRIGNGIGQGSFDPGRMIPHAVVCLNENNELFTETHKRTFDRVVRVHHDRNEQRKDDVDENADEGVEIDL